jgi:hypothetical protein
VVRRFVRSAARWLNPTTLGLALLTFVLPFVTVSCDAPGGYGHGQSGTTTAYTGVDLVVGAEPKFSPPEKAKPPETARDVRLPPQPAAIAVLLLLVATIAYAVRTQDPRVRRGGVALLAAIAATALLVNQALVESAVAVKVGDQLTEPLPAGKVLRDFVKTGPGFGLCLLLLALVAVVNVIGWWTIRARPALVAAPPIQPPPTQPLSTSDRTTEQLP